jgi:hypothetical protein
LVFSYFVLAAFVALMLFAIQIYRDTKPKMDDVVCGPVLEDYAENPVKADKKYGGKTVIISGEVRRINKMDDGNHEIILYARGDHKDFYYVQCDNFLELNKVTRGNTVTIKGRPKFLAQTWYGEGGSMHIEPLPQLTDCQMLPNK